MLRDHDADHDLRRDVKDLKGSYREIKRMIDDANARWSEKHGETIAKIGNLDLAVVRLQVQMDNVTPTRTPPHGA